MPTTETEQITITFPTGKVMNKVVDDILRIKPKGWSRKSYAPYYKEVYGKWMQAQVDKMIESKQSLSFAYEKFHGVSHQSIYLRINQSLRYLVEKLDTVEGKYRTFLDTVRVRRLDTGIKLELDPLITGDIPSGELLDSDDALIPKWRFKVDEYLDDVEAKAPLIIRNVILSHEQIQQLESELKGLRNVMFSITSTEIKIIKTS